MSEPFDLDAAVGELSPEPFRFTWGGQAFELPAILGMPVDKQLTIINTIEGLDRAEPGKVVEVLHLIVGDEMLASLSAAKPLSAASLMKLIGAWMAHQGEAPGKSEPSSDSSASTARPSKQTLRSGRARRTS